MGVMSFVATGDSFITSRLPEKKDDNFKKIKELIEKAEIKFTNLEVTVHNDEGTPAAFSGGTWAKASPYVLEDIEYFGFNTLNIANNHTLDYSFDGLKATEDSLKKYKFVYAGAGNNLSEASNPKYISTSGGRVGFVAATSTFYESWVAGEQRRDMKGRPGVNSLRVDSTYMVSKEHMKMLKEVSNKTEINAMNNLNYKEGFEIPPQEGLFKFGKYLFKESNQEGLIRTPKSEDLERIIRTILEGKRQAKEVIVSIHSHEFEDEDKNIPSDFLKDFARECIDAGAGAVIGHGPHVLRGIEIYKGRPIFYSLGNFIFQNDLVENLPSDFYKKYNLGPLDNPADAFDKRSKNNTVGLGQNPLVWKSVIAEWEVKDSKIDKIVLHPIDLGYDVPRYERGLPKITKDVSIIKHLSKLSEEFGTEIDIVDNKGVIKLNQK